VTTTNDPSRGCTSARVCHQSKNAIDGGFWDIPLTAIGEYNIKNSVKKILTEYNNMIGGPGRRHLIDVRKLFTNLKIIWPMPIIPYRTGAK